MLHNLYPGIIKDYESIETRLALLEVNLHHTNENLKRIEEKLDRLDRKFWGIRRFIPNFCG